MKASAREGSPQEEMAETPAQEAAEQGTPQEMAETHAQEMAEQAALQSQRDADHHAAQARHMRQQRRSGGL